MEKKRDSKQARAHIAKKVRQRLLKIKKEPCYCHPGCDILSDQQKAIPGRLMFQLYNFVKFDLCFERNFVIVTTSGSCSGH